MRSEKKKGISVNTKVFSKLLTELICSEFSQYIYTYKWYIGTVKLNIPPDL